MSTTTYRRWSCRKPLRRRNVKWSSTHSGRCEVAVSVPLLHFLGLIAICFAVCPWGTARIVHAGEPATAAADAAIVRPFVSETTVFIIKVDSRGIGLPDLAKTLETMSPDAQRAYRQVMERARAGIEQLRRLVNDRPIYATVGIPISPTRVPSFVFVKDLLPQNAAKLIELSHQGSKSGAVIHGDYVVTTLVETMDVAKSLAASPASSRDGIEEAFASVATYPVQVLMLPPSYVWRTIRELSPELPRQLGGGPSSVLTEGIKWAALGVDPAQLRAQLVIHSASEAAARDLAAHLPRMLQSICKTASEIDKRFPAELSQALISQLRPQVDGERIAITIEGFGEAPANLKLLALAARTVEEKTRRYTNSKRFKKIVIAMHNYHDVNGTFPPADKDRDKDGTYHLSWRVYILPFIGQQELYDQFRLDQPWDSPHNKKLIAKMPDIYKSESFGTLTTAAIKPGYTSFLAPVGEDTVFGGAEATTFGKIHDGTSNTIVLVEVKPERAVPWTAPEDYAFDAKDPAAGLMIGADGRWLCAAADGAVHQLRGDIPAETLLHLFQMSDGHVTDFHAIR